MQQNVESRGVKGGLDGPGGYREVWLLAYPIVITMLSRTAMMFVDTAMVGRLGATELAAVGLAGILTWTFGVARDLPRARILSRHIAA